MTVIDQTLRGLGLRIEEATNPGERPELAYSFVNNANQTWTLARIKGLAPAGFGGQLVVETNAGSGVPDDITIERLRIDQNGNVGIGTNAPTQALEVAGTVRATAFQGNGSALTGISDPSKVSKAGDTMTGALNLPPNGLIVGSQLVLANGNVGIGTAAPQARLQVTGGAIMPAVGNSAAAGIYFPTNPGGGGGDEAFIRYYVESGERTKFLIGTNNDAEDSIGLWQAGGERLTIYNGNVGIGTTGPDHRLTVAGEMKTYGITFTTGAGWWDPGGRAAIVLDNGGYKALMIVGSEQSQGKARWIRMWDTVTVEGKLEVSGDIQLAAGKTISSPGRFHISGAELLYLLNKSGVIVSKAWGGNGNLTVEGNIVEGGAALSDKYAARDHLTSNDRRWNLVMQDDRNIVGYQAGGGAFWASGTNISDIELKRDVKPIEGALEKLHSVRGVSFHWRDVSMGTARELGVIAHEVEATFPELVTYPTARTGSFITKSSCPCSLRH